MQGQSAGPDKEAEAQYLREFTEALRGAILASVPDASRENTATSLDMYRLFKKSELAVQQAVEQSVA